MQNTTLHYIGRTWQVNFHCHNGSINVHMSPACTLLLWSTQATHVQLLVARGSQCYKVQFSLYLKLLKCESLSSYSSFLYLMSRDIHRTGIETILSSMLFGKSPPSRSTNETADVTSCDSIVGGTVAILQRQTCMNNNHPLIRLIQQCLHNVPVKSWLGQRRPSGESSSRWDNW